MVIYLLDNQCFLYQILMHRLGCNGDKKAVLFVNKGMRIKSYLFKLKEGGIFSDVIELPLLYNNRGSETATEQDFKKFFDNVFDASKYSFDKFKDICLINDRWDGDINLYLNLINKSYTWIQVNRNQDELMPQYVSNAFANILIKYRSHTPFAAYAKPCLLKASDSSQQKLRDKGYSLWDISECVNSLTEKELEIIADCYELNLDEYSQTKLKTSVLLLLNSYGYSIRSLVEYKYKSEYIKNIVGFDNRLEMNVTPYAKLCSVMSRLAMDFYAPEADSYYVKLHPNEPVLSEDVIRYYYGDKAVPFTSMPFELVGRLFKLKNLKFGTMLTYAHSTDTFKCDRDIVLGDNFCYTWFFYCSIYVSLMYAVKNSLKNIYCSKILFEQLIFLIDQFKLDIAVNVVNFYDLPKLKAIKEGIFICNLLDEKYGDVNCILNNVNSDCTVCFLNADCAEYFFDEDRYFNFASIKIEKESNSFRSFNLEREETVWVYSSKKAYRDAALAFELNREMPHSGYTVRVKKHSVAESTNLFRQLAALNSVHSLEKRVIQVENVIKVACFNDDGSTTKKLLAACGDLSEYIQLLSIIKNRYFIALAVKDTSGDLLTQDMLDGLHGLGFNKLKKELWHMYVGVIYNGSVAVDICGAAREEPVTYSATDMTTGTAIKLSSMAWRNGNKAEMLIGGTDYAVNVRGLNIVVYDLQKEELIDSVAFDYHVSHKCVRK